MSKHIIVYSHGFGVSKDDRGLFTDISDYLPKIAHIMFDYNIEDKNSNTLIVSSLTNQVKKLSKILSDVEEKHSNATIDLICHSQGCLVAAMLKPDKIRKTIFIAPPDKLLSYEESIKQMSIRPGTAIKDNVVIYPRRDGSTTIIPNDYWQSRRGIIPVNLYTNFADLTLLTIINAIQDEILGKTDFNVLSNSAKIIPLNANHDFTGNSRKELITNIQQIIL